MTPVEAAALLTVASAYDNRKVTEEAAIAWADALRSLPAADCRDAIRDHYRDTTEWLMPGHIKGRVAKIRARRIEAAGVPEIPSGMDPDDEASYRRWLAETRGLTADGNPPPPPVLAPAQPGRIRELLTTYRKDQG